MYCNKLEINKIFLTKTQLLFTPLNFKANRNLVFWFYLQIAMIFRYTNWTKNFTLFGKL